MAVLKVADETLGAAVSAERALVASVMMDPGTIADVAGEVTAADFTDHLYREIFQAAEQLWELRIPADFVNLAEYLEKNGSRVSLLDLSSILSGGGQEGYSVYARYYAKRITNAARFRRVQDAWSSALLTVAADPEIDPAEAIMAAIGSVVATGSTDRQTLSAAELLPDLLARIDAERQGTRKRIVYGTGLGAIDNLMGGGIRPGELMILAARPSMGKTALGVQASIRQSIFGQSMIFSLEMDRDAILRRALANMAWVEHDRIDGARLPDDLFRKLEVAAKRLSALPLIIDDSSGITSDQIAVRVQRQQASGPVSTVLVDYLEMVGDRHDHEERRLTGIARRLKELARQAEVGVVLLAQVSREVEKRTPQIPRLSDLRWSGSLEAIADKIAFLYREDYYLDKGMLKPEEAEAPGSGVTQFRLDKHRNGATGIARVEFNGPTFAFRSRSLEPEVIDPGGPVYEAQAAPL